MKLITISAGLLALALATAAHAQEVAKDPTPWKGFYAGINVGGAWNSTCNTWQLNDVTNPAFINAFNNRDCPNNGVFVGGVQIGYNFQHEQWVWGFGLDYDNWSAKNRNRTFNYVGPGQEGGAPSGTFNFSG
jgi:outer membrane immunogenic protein